MVSNDTWAALASTYTTEHMMDVVFSVGQYNPVSWALNSFGVPLDDFLPDAQAKAARAPGSHESYTFYPLNILLKRSVR